MLKGILLELWIGLLLLELKRRLSSIIVFFQSPLTEVALQKTVHSIFRRQMTPYTMQHLRETYFDPTSAEKFKNVWTDKRCLRCFSNTHGAIACPVYTRPTPNVCKFCHYLYHSADKCIFFDGSGNSRPSSQNRTV